MISRFSTTGLVAVALLTACGPQEPVAPGLAADSPVVLALAPANAATGVNPAGPIVVTFSRPMMAGMEALVVLHEGTVTGPAVPGVATWSSDRMTLTFTPSAPLKARTVYVLHLAPGLRGADGKPINLQACESLGGRYVTGAMMGIGSGSGMMTGQGGAGMMGDGWRSADGMYGMVFTFTTA